MGRRYGVGVHIDRFDSTLHLCGRQRTYAAVRAAVLEAGRFSVFEATDTVQSARLFERLERDPSVIVKRDYGYPWIGPVIAAGKGKA